MAGLICANPWVMKILSVINKTQIVAGSNLKYIRPRRLFVRAVWLTSLIATGLTVAGPAPGEGNAGPLPVVERGQTGLEFDFPAMKIGIAEYEEGPTGTTVFYFPDGVKAAVDVRGGSPGTVNATALMNAYEYKMIQSVVFSGGSWYGLSAATGVANEIKNLKAQEGQVDFIAGVVAAIIYDVGGRRYSRITPDDRLGAAALRSARPGFFPTGSRGAGRFAMQGSYYVRGESMDKFADWPHSGQGGAFASIGPTRVGVFTVVNSLGTIVDRNGRIVRCKRNQPNGGCPLISDRIASFASINGDAQAGKDGKTENTTLTLVVTNQKMPFWALQRLAVQVHGSMNRAIQPFATEDDGDVLYAVTTDEVENASLSPLDLGVVASELAWDAVLSSVPQLPAAPLRLEDQPGEKFLQPFAGAYDFYGGNQLVVSVEDGVLMVRATYNGNSRIYFDRDRSYRLTAAQDGLFIVESAAQDVIRFEHSEGKVTGLTINPGPWAVSAVLGTR
jgi:L-aminopeptidase/D-esterase-like protein